MFFTELGFGLQLTEDDNILLQNRLGEPFCYILQCSGKSKLLRKILLFYRHTIYFICIKFGIGLSLRLKQIAMDLVRAKRVYHRNNHSYHFPFYSHLPLKWQTMAEDPSNVFKFHLNFSVQFLLITL